jgi:hypothetical protein
MAVYKIGVLRRKTLKGAARPTVWAGKRCARCSVLDQRDLLPTLRHTHSSGPQEQLTNQGGGGASLGICSLQG